MAECTICLDQMRNPLVTPCGHSFCRDCIVRLPTVGQITGRFCDRQICCPECRHVFPFSATRPNVSLQRAIDAGTTPTSAQAGGADDGHTPSPSFSAATTTSAPPPRYTPHRVAPHTQRIDRHYERELVSLGATAALMDHLTADEARVGSRIYLLDNSGSTAVEDGTMVKATTNGAFKYVNCSRWEEIKQIARDQARHNMGFGHVAEFHLLNPKQPGREVDGVDFCCLNPNVDVETELARLDAMLSMTRPMKGTPLAERLVFLRRRISLHADRSAEAGKEMFLVIVTDGVPTPMVWTNTVSEARQLADAKTRMVDELYKIMGQYPVSLVVRLCTDSEHEIDFWTKVDENEEFSLDVIDDVRGEANEIHDSGNTFLTYSLALHRIREGGSCQRLLDLLDEKRFVAKQRQRFLDILLTDSDQNPLPAHDARGFDDEVKKRVSKLPPVWNPRTGKMDVVARPRNSLALSSMVILAMVVLFFAIAWQRILTSSGSTQGHYHGSRHR